MVNWKKLVKSIPSRVQISSKVFYEITWIDAFQDPTVCGETRFQPNHIVIKKGMSPKLTVVTYLHEVAHACSSEHEVSLTENQILSMEKFFYFMLKDDNIFRKVKK